MPFFQKHGLHVEEILEQVRGYWISSIIITAIELDVFSIIDDREVTVDSITESFPINKDGLERLLNALVSLNLLQKHDSIFANTFTAFTHLNRNSDQYIGHIILYHQTRYDVWGRLGESVRSGKPLAAASFLNPNQELIDNYARAMHARAKLDTPNIISRIDLSDCKHILDLGGAPGTFAVGFAEKYPNLQITVFDLPDMIPIAQEIVGEYNLANQINFISGNFELDAIGSNYCAVFMSQILSSLGSQEVHDLFKKVYSALKVGGRIILRDLILRNENTEPDIAVFRSLNVLLTTEQGRTYGVEELQEMLLDVGFLKPKFLQLMGPTDLVIAKKK
ncbi:MAG: methyltransferase [Candidatus Hodarchaeales archaeon]|jgi:predicted O-methyltransferase YrrM